MRQPHQPSWPWCQPRVKELSCQSKFDAGATSTCMSNIVLPSASSSVALLKNLGDDYSSTTVTYSVPGNIASLLPVLL